MNSDDLAAASIRKEGQDYILECPKCFKDKLSARPDGPFQCWSCSYRGHVSQLALLDKPQAARKDSMDSNPYKDIDFSSPKIGRYLHETRGLGTIPPGLEFGWHLPTDSIAIPYPNCKAMKVKGGAGKTFVIAKEDFPGYFQPIPITTDVVIVEGEFDALAALQLTEIPVMALCGVANVRKPVAALPTSLQRAFLWLDNDAAGQGAIPTLAAALRARFPGLAIHIISYPDNSKAKDPNDLLLSRTAFNLQEAASEYTEDKLARKASYYFKDMVEFLSDDTRAQGVPTGLAGLDAMLGGGKRLGEVTALQAMAKTGKNCLWHQLMWYWAEAGIPMGYASRELAPDQEVLPNLLSIHTKQNLWKQGKGMDPAALEKIVARWPIHFAHGYGVFDIDQIKAWVAELTSIGVKYFWIDHFHYCLHDPENPKEISLFARELKKLAKENNIHIDLIVQPKYIDQDKGLGLQTLRGGAAIGQAIDNLFVLERVTDVAHKNVSRLRFVAGRHKLCNTGDSIYLQYEPETTRMMEVKMEEQARDLAAAEQPARSWRPGRVE